MTPIIKHRTISVSLTVLFLISSILFSACLRYGIDDENILAKVNNRTLYLEDILPFIPKNISQEDSLKLIRKYTEEWVIEEMMYYKAKKKLRDTLSIMLKVNDYRQQLYTHNYLSQQVYGKIDHYVSKSEVIDYYEKNLGDLILESPYIKAHYIAMPANASYYRERNMVMQTEPDDFAKLQDFCNGTARQAFILDDWTSADYLLRIINFTDFDINNLRVNRLIENEDEENNIRYIVKINDLVSAGKPKPLEIIYDNIVEIIINKRRVEALEKKRLDLLRESKSLGYIFID